MSANRRPTFKPVLLDTPPAGAQVGRFQIHPHSLQPLTIYDSRVKRISVVTVKPETVKVAWLSDGFFCAWNTGPCLLEPLECEYQVI